MRLGVIQPPGYPCPVVYELVDEWAPQTAGYQTGGEITQHVRTGRKVPEARLLGSTALLERCVPLLHELCVSVPAGYQRPEIQVAIEETKRILSDVRWGYGPFSEISSRPAALDSTK